MSANLIVIIQTPRPLPPDPGFITGALQNVPNPARFAQPAASFQDADVAKLSLLTTQWRPSEGWMLTGTTAGSLTFWRATFQPSASFQNQPSPSLDLTRGYWVEDTGWVLQGIAEAGAKTSKLIIAAEQQSARLFMMGQLPPFDSRYYPFTPEIGFDQANHPDNPHTNWTRPAICPTTNTNWTSPAKTVTYPGPSPQVC